MSAQRLRCICMAMLSLLLLLAPELAGAAALEYISVPATRRGWVHSIAIQRPDRLASRGLLLIVPGMSGIGDLGFDYEIQRDRYDPTTLGGWSQVFLRRGYSIATVNTRGIRRPEHCLSDRNAGDSRLRDFVERCIDVDARLSADFATHTADLKDVYALLARFESSIFIVPLSMGGYYAAALIRTQSARPAGWLSIGVPWESVRELSRLQSMQRRILDGVQRSLQKSGKASALASEFSSPALPSVDQAQLENVLRSNEVSDATIERARAFWATFYDGIMAKYLALDDRAPINGHYGGYPAPVVYGGRWMKEFLTNGQSVPRDLAGYDRPMVFIHGERDLQMDVPTAGACPASFTGPCKVIVVPGMPHGPNLPDGTPSPAAVRAVEEGLRWLGAQAEDLSKPRYVPDPQQRMPSDPKRRGPPPGGPRTRP